MEIAFPEFLFGLIFKIRNRRRFLFFYFPKITRYLFILLWTLLFIAKFSLPRWSTRYWPCKFFSVESYSNKFFKRGIIVKAKRNEFEEIIEILICEDTIVNTLEFFIGLNSILKCWSLWSIFVVLNKFGYFNFTLFFGV